MKKSTGSILLLSAFAALVLAGCGTEGSSSSQETGSSDTAALTSTEDASTSADASASEGGNSTASASNSTTASSTASSSSSAVETDWSNKDFTGQYLGGMTSLVINNDKTLSWGTSTDKVPATYTDLGGGVYEIKAAAGTADEDYIEVITDGTMAYVLHDKGANDYYVMDKRAQGSAAIAFAETADEETFFGGIEVTSGHWKYFACIDGTYHFDVSITLQAGRNINVGGAIFDYGTGANKISFKVVREAPTSTAFAKIEQTTFTAATYTGEHGELVIGTDNDGLVFATLNGTECNNAVLSADGTKLSVPNGASGSTYDMTNEAGPSKVVPCTNYTLSRIAGTYAESEGSMLTPLFEEATGQTGTYTGTTDAGGHVWVWFTCPVDGKITITEDAGTSYTQTGSYYYDYLVVYDTATTPIDNYDSTYGSGVVKSASGNGNAEIKNLYLEEGHTYVVRLGSSSDNYKDWTSTGSSYADEDLTLSWVFTPFVFESYTGDLGTIDLVKDGTEVIKVKIAGQPVDDYEINPTTNTMTTVASVLDMTNPLNPAYTTTTTSITLDSTTNTYTATATPVTTHPFHALSETDTSYTGVTGNDGNIWLTFTPSKDGSIEILETAMGVGDSYIQIFEYDPTAGISGLTTSGKRLAYDDNSFDCGVSANVSVKAGHTYVIKLGDWNSRDLVVGDTTTYSEDIGCSETFTFAYYDYTVQTFTGADGDLVITTKDGKAMSASIDSNAVVGRMSYDAASGTFTIIGTQTLDNSDPNNPVLTSTDTVYTLDLDEMTYVKTTESGSRPVYQVLEEDSTVLSGYAGEDGNIWGIFTPTNDGLLTLDETVSTSSDGLITVYESTATSYTYGNQKVYGDFNGSCSGGGKITDFAVTAGKTYIIKAGAYVDRGKAVGDTGSSYAGNAENVTFDFRAIYTNVYTCEGADSLTIKTMNGEIYGTPTLGTAPVNGILSPNGKTFTGAATVSAVNAADPLDPIETRTSTVYYLDNSAMTYEATSKTEDVHIMKTLSPTDTTLSAFVGKDGNLWAKFTAPEDGKITVDETKTTHTDNYLQVFLSTATAFKSTTKTDEGRLASADFNGTASGGGKITNLNVEGGKTYIIKAGAYGDKDRVPGDGTTSSYVGKQETISFTYAGFTHETFTGSEGDLVKNYFDGAYVNASLNGQPFTATPNTDKTVYVGKSVTFDPTTFTATTTTKTYTLGEGTYEVETSSTDTELLSDTWTAGNSGTYQSLANGAVIIKFTPTVDGTYTFKVAGVAGKDLQIGLFSADLDETGFADDPLEDADNGYGGAGETLEYECTAGTTYYLKVSTYGDFGNSITNLNSTNVGLSFTVEIVEPTPAP